MTPYLVVTVAAANTKKKILKKMVTSFSSLVTPCCTRQEHKRQQQATFLLIVIGVVVVFGILQMEVFIELNTQQLELQKGKQIDAVASESAALDSSSSDQVHQSKNNQDSITNHDHNSLSWCPSLPLWKAGAGTSSASHVWNNLQDQILNASYLNLPRIETLNASQLEAYQDWVDQLYSFYTPSKLRRTIMNPAPPKEIMQLMNKAVKIKEHNTNISSSKKEEKQHLRILLLGGSVAAGVGCSWPDNLNIEKPKHFSVPAEACAWSFQLEKLLNHVLFDGDDVVIITNISSGGQTSEIGAYVLEYQLFPKPEHVPDVIIASFSPNESREADMQKVLYEYNQNFVEAARSLNPCNDQAPLVMFVDDFYGGLPYRATVQSGNVFMLSTWYNVMAVNYASAIKYKIHGEAEGQDAEARRPLLFSDFDNQIHLGVGMHMGVAWAVMFNIVNSIVNACNDGSIGLESHGGGSSFENTTIVNVTATETSAMELNTNTLDEEDANFVNDRNKNTSNDTAQDDSGGVADKQRFQLDPNLLPNLQKDEPPFQHIGRMKPNIYGDINEYRKELEESMNATKEFCENLRKNSVSGGGELPAVKRCYYSWIINSMTGFFRFQHIEKALSKVLLQNEGWIAEGYPIQQPRAGWYSHTANSTFSILLDNVDISVKYVTILSMKSYSLKWFDSKLAVSTSVLTKGGGANETIKKKVRTRDELQPFAEKIISEIDWNANAVDDDSLSYIDGYHDIQSSVHFVHKIPIASGGAQVGDSVLLTAKLIGGQEFKIAGIAFCSF